MLAAAAIDRVRQVRQAVKVVKASRVGEIVRLKNSPAAFLELESIRAERQRIAEGVK
jgi:hypothetical protein